MYSTDYHLTRRAVTSYIATAMQLNLFLAASLAIGTVSARCSSLKTYPIPEGIPQSDLFEVKVRNNASEWVPLEAYQVPHHEVNTTTGSSKRYFGAMVYFDFVGGVEVSVRSVAKPLDSARIRPDSYGIVPDVKDDTITFTLDKPRNVVVQPAKGDVFNVLHLFANTVVDEDEFRNRSDVIFYEPGLHKLDEFTDVPSGKTLYLAGGAVLQGGGLNLNETTGAAIRGHGVMYRPRAHTMEGYRTKNALIEDIIVIDPGHYTVNLAEAEDVTIRGLRTFSAVGWGDGIDIFSSKNILVDNVFLRTSDDSVAIYTHRWNYFGDTTNVTIQNSSLWADLAHGVNIGTHGNTANPEELAGITIRNVDILDHRELQMGYQGCIALNPGDSNLLRDVLIEDVRVEDFRHGQLITMMVMYNQKYNTSPGRGISNVTIRDLTYNGSNAGPTIITGYNETRGIEGVRFENLKINGRVVSDTMAKPAWYLTSDFVPAYVNEHVWNLTFM